MGPMGELFRRFTEKNKRGLRHMTDGGCDQARRAVNASIARGQIPHPHWLAILKGCRKK